jgi:hypothetical protein
MNPNGKLDKELCRRMLDEYCFFWSFEARGNHESETGIHKENFSASMMRDFKLPQSVMYDMNESLLG